MNVPRVLPLALALTALAPPAGAATCQVSATNLAFGQYRFNSDVDVESSATISIENCADDGSGSEVAYSIAISPGLSGTYGMRAMAGPSGALLYNVYADASHLLVWGDGTGGSVTVDGVFTLFGATSASHVLHGRIPAHQADVAPGPYGDTLAITITY